MCTGAHLLIPVPGDSLKVKVDDLPGPGGVLVCAENFVMYMHEGHETLRALIPRRQNLPADRHILLLTAATHKMRNQFVVLAQSEYGDMYKVRASPPPPACAADAPLPARRHLTALVRYTQCKGERCDS